ncbi:MFS general substrate transporter [Cadophora sp. DSE1049]|nr:MFS general substrate transporter [Cadophora sp. DSE1049]
MESVDSIVPSPQIETIKILSSFFSSRESLEKEGVYVGGWSLEGVVTPKKTNGKRDSSEDRIEENTVSAEWTAKEESRLVRKLDMRVLFPCTIVYFLAYLDRANLGAVKILEAGTRNSLEHSLGLVGKQFNWSVSITYFAVTAGLLPANIIMKKVSAKYFFPSIMILWGIVIMSIAASKNAAGLMAGRFFLGIPEAGVVPASVMYFSMWYKPSERALRISVFHSANALAAAVSAFIASGIGSLQGAKGLHAWQWVFIIEGAAPVALSIPVFLLLLTFPETSTALSERERFIAVNRFGRGAARKTDSWSWATVLRIFSRPSTYVFFVAYVSMYPNEDSPNYVAGFTGTLALLVVCIAAYLSLPFWLLLEANMRRKKTGYGIPLQALEDAENSEVSPNAREISHGDDLKRGEGETGEGGMDFRGNDLVAISHVEKV